MREIGRAPGIIYDLDAKQHLPQCLAASRERHEIADVLDQHERQQRNLRQDRQLVERHAANLHREVDNRRVGPGQYRNVDDCGEHPRDDARGFPGGYRYRLDFRRMNHGSPGRRGAGLDLGRDEIEQRRPPLRAAQP